MALSPNYNWSEPDNSSLVKDGALAMRTLGDAIDTTMATKAVATNPVLNSAMQCWQRGTSFAITTPVYTADRWQAARAANASGSTVTRQVTNDTTNLPNIQYCLRQQRDSGNAGTGTLYLSQSFESINSIPFAGKTITVSYYARCGANFSPTSSIVNFKLQSGTGTDQNNLTGAYTGSANVTNVNTTLTTTWQRFSSTGTVAATATELAFLIEHTPTGTAGAADFFEVTGLQIDIGSVALPFRTNGATIQGELAACMRYFVVYGGDKIFERFGNGSSDATTSGRVLAHLPVPMRTTPSLTISATADWQLVLPGVAGAATTAITLSSDESSTKIASLTATIASTAGFGDSKAVVLCGNGTTNARINLSAEL
jgi:hypothetical protein